MHWISEYTRLAVDLRGEWSLRCIHMDTIVYSLQLHLQNCFPSVYDLVRDSRTTSNTEASFMFLPRWWQWRWTAGLSTGMNPHNSHKSRWRGWRSPTHKDNPDVYVCETCTMSNRIIPARPSMYRNLDAPLPSRPVAYEFIYKAISTSRRTVWTGHREYELVYQAIPWRSTCCQQWPTISFEGRPPHQRCDHHYTSLECIVPKCNVLYCRSMWHPLATCSELQRNSLRLHGRLLLPQASISFPAYLLQLHNGGSRDVTFCYYASWKPSDIRPTRRSTGTNFPVLEDRRFLTLDTTWDDKDMKEETTSMLPPAWIMVLLRLRVSCKLESPKDNNCVQPFKGSKPDSSI